MINDDQPEIPEEKVESSQEDTLIISNDLDVIDLNNYGAAQSSMYIGSGIDSSTITITGSSGSSTLGTISIPSYTTSYSLGNSYTGIGSGWNNGNSKAVKIDENGIDLPDDKDIKIGEKSLKEFMTKMEERLAILVPDPAKLEKFEALKKAYEHYKLMEKLCQEDTKDDDEC